MLKKRQMLCIEAEAETSSPYHMPDLAELLGLPEHAPVLTDLTSTSRQDFKPAQKTWTPRKSTPKQASSSSNTYSWLFKSSQIWLRS